MSVKRWDIPAQALFNLAHAPQSWSRWFIWSDTTTGWFYGTIDPQHRKWEVIYKSASPYHAKVLDLLEGGGFNNYLVERFYFEAWPDGTWRCYASPQCENWNGTSNPSDTEACWRCGEQRPVAR